MRALPVAVVAALLAGCVAQPSGLPSLPGGSPETPAPVAWASHAEGPTPRTEVAAAALGSDVYVLGGFDGGGANVRTVEVYDASRDAWRRGPDLPVPLHHTALVAHEGALFVFGGMTTEAFLPIALAFRLDPARGAWEPLAPLPAARGAHAAAVLDGKAYVVGGFGLDRALTRAVHAYAFGADAWSEGPPMPTGRHHLAAAAVGGRVLVAGGDLRTHAENSDALEALDPASGWTRLAPMPAPRGSVAAAAWRDLLVVVGGQDGDGTFATVEAYDPATDSWRALPDMPTPRHGLGAATVGDRAYVLLGGPEPGQSATGAVESLGEGPAR